jgi:hypothetical protein
LALLKKTGQSSARDCQYYYETLCKQTFAQTMIIPAGLQRENPIHHQLMVDSIPWQSLDGSRRWGPISPTIGGIWGRRREDLTSESREEADEQMVAINNRAR